jgi:hypothetical protein
MANRKGDTVVAVAAAVSAAQIFKRGFTARFMSSFSRTALRRGMHSGSKAWLYVGAAASGLKLLQSVAGRKEEVTRIKLRKGERLEIREVARRK